MLGNIKMMRCPHCAKLCNPLRLFFFWNSKGYCCPNCKKRSSFKTRQLQILGAIFGGIAGYCGANISRHFEWWPALLYFVIIVLIITLVHVLVMYLFLDLSPMPKQKNHRHFLGIRLRQKNYTLASNKLPDIHLENEP